MMMHLVAWTCVEGADDVNVMIFLRGFLKEEYYLREVHLLRWISQSDPVTLGNCVCLVQSFILSLLDVTYLSNDPKLRRGGRGEVWNISGLSHKQKLSSEVTTCYVIITLLVLR